ncbi:homoserine dehydrogenase [Fervidicella metallireducens AeB]|uniref:Homoserine dehydrogenase n=1 Tax=Fervidicella metallireducens AeB TaxID=1403537 RepID=A0A017RV95_9CLOT|nr:homoserine dehydrogenase [Fervidicella metallireducens]EYE88572.1 homoserine dehydrogenase [Fervidicella metallireducens AeB]
MRLALIGVGNVGKAFIKLLAMKKNFLLLNNIELELCLVANSKGAVYSQFGIDCNNLIGELENGQLLENNIEFKKDVDVIDLIKACGIETVILATPTNKNNGEPGITYIKKFLSYGINVVTADKGPVLIDYHGLAEIAKRNKARLGIGCTTGGALPSINGGIIELAGSDVYKIEGVLNGTTNFILKEMEDKIVSYEEALKTAQLLGIAESNPTLDVEGFDTATKILILSNVIMKSNKKIEDISIQGITDITVEKIQKAKEEGKRYKLIGTAEKTGDDVNISVKLEKINFLSDFYNVEGKNKAVKYYSDTLGELTIVGGASGTIPAAASLLRDIINIYRNNNNEWY